MIDGRGVEIALFRGVADAGSTQLWLVERIGNQCGAAFRNSQINSDRGDPPFLNSRGYGSSFLPLDLDQRFTSPVPTESPRRRDFNAPESQSERRIFDEQSIQLASRECRRVFSGWGEARGGA
jgi:hypothetical protein